MGEYDPIVGGENAEIIENAELIMLTVPFEHAVQTLSTYQENFHL